MTTAQRKTALEAAKQRALDIYMGKTQQYESLTGEKFDPAGAGLAGKPNVSRQENRLPLPDDIDPSTLSKEEIAYLREQGYAI